MLYKKAQEGIKALFMTLIIAGVMAVIGVLIYANVSNTSNDIFPTVNKYANNESVTISVGDSALGDNSTLLAQAGYLTDSERVINNSNGYLLKRNSDYKITLQDGLSGALTTRANFTLLNITGNKTVAGTVCSPCGFNNSELDITYSYADKSDARKLKEGAIDDTTLDAFELGVVALIVLAASVIIGMFYWFNK